MSRSLRTSTATSGQNFAESGNGTGATTETLEEQRRRLVGGDPLPLDYEIYHGGSVEVEPVVATPQEVQSRSNSLREAYPMSIERKLQVKNSSSSVVAAAHRYIDATEPIPTSFNQVTANASSSRPMQKDASRSASPQVQSSAPSAFRSQGSTFSQPYPPPIKQQPQAQAQAQPQLQTQSQAQPQAQAQQQSQQQQYPQQQQQYPQQQQQYSQQQQQYPPVISTSQITAAVTAIVPTNTMGRALVKRSSAPTDIEKHLLAPVHLEGVEHASSPSITESPPQPTPKPVRVAVYTFSEQQTGWVLDSQGLLTIRSSSTELPSLSVTRQSTQESHVYAWAPDFSFNLNDKHIYVKQQHRVIFTFSFNSVEDAEYISDRLRMISTALQHFQHPGILHFWTTNSFPESIPLLTLSSALDRKFHTHITDELFDEFSRLLDAEATHSVNAITFQMFVDWFGPWEFAAVNFVKYSNLLGLRQIIKNSWFYGFYSRNQSLTRLNGTKDGSFLIRCSSKSLCFAVDLQRENQVEHILLPWQSGVFRLETQSGTVEYSTLTELVHQQSDILCYPVPIDSKPQAASVTNASNVDLHRYSNVDVVRTMKQPPQQPPPPPPPPPPALPSSSHLYAPSSPSPSSNASALSAFPQLSSNINSHLPSPQSVIANTAAAGSTHPTNNNNNMTTHQLHPQYQQNYANRLSHSPYPPPQLPLQPPQQQEHYHPTSPNSHDVVDRLEQLASEIEIPWEDLKLIRQIGSGGFGEVYEGSWHGTPVAIKLLSKQHLSERELADFRAEVLMMAKLRHPNIVQFLGTCLKPQHLALITEYMNQGSLYSLLHPHSSKTGRPLSLEKTIKVAKQIAQGVNHLHMHRPPILHRDLKSLNILVASGGDVIKLCDFGLSKVKEGTHLMTKVGTPRWTAPEILSSQPYTEKADVYSFAIVLWEMITGEVPFVQMSSVEAAQAVVQKCARPTIPSNIPRELDHLIASCWAQDPTNRPSFTDVLERLDVVEKYTRPTTTTSS